MRRETLRDCADELELAWHAYAHDAAWFPESCPLCEAEMATMRPGEPPRSQREAMLTTSEEARELWRRGRQGHTDLGDVGFAKTLPAARVTFWYHPLLLRSEGDRVRTKCPWCETEHDCHGGQEVLTGRNAYEVYRTWRWYNFGVKTPAWDELPRKAQRQWTRVVSERQESRIEMRFYERGDKP